MGAGGITPTRLSAAGLAIGTDPTNSANAILHAESDINTVFVTFEGVTQAELSAGAGWLGWAGTGDNDMIYGSDVDDYLVGWDGKDFLYGYAGNDSLYGTNGDDTLFGGAGNDILGGGAGKDTFVISVDGTGANTLNGSDTITDFDVTAATGDIVHISWQGGGDAPSDLAGAGLALGTNGSDAVLTDSADTSIIYLTFEGIAQADLVEATHFDFV